MPRLFTNGWNSHYDRSVSRKIRDARETSTLATHTYGHPGVNNLRLLYDPKDAVSLYSHRWNVDTNPYLTLTSFGQDSRLPDKRVLGKFPRSQHYSSHITSPRHKVPAHSDPVKRWSFRKADWKRFCLLTDESVERSPTPAATNIKKAYQEFGERLLSTDKQCIPRGHCKNYVPIWNKECGDHLLLRHPSSIGDRF